MYFLFLLFASANDPQSSSPFFLPSTRFHIMNQNKTSANWIQSSSTNIHSKNIIKNMSFYYILDRYFYCFQHISIYAVASEIHARNILSCGYNVMLTLIGREKNTAAAHFSQQFCSMERVKKSEPLEKRNNRTASSDNQQGRR